MRDCLGLFREDMYGAGRISAATGGQLAEEAEDAVVKQEAPPTIPWTRSLDARVPELRAFDGRKKSVCLSALG